MSSNPNVSPGPDREAVFRSRELFHELRIPGKRFFVLRADGRSFSRLTREHFTPPFDLRFHDLMISTARHLVADLDATAAYTHSDEISVFFSPSYDSFDREVEKLVSVSAAAAAAAFSAAFGEPVSFDSRVAIVGDLEEVCEYAVWRRSNARRSAVNSLAYWTARNEGLSPRAAARQTSGPVTEKLRFLRSRGVDIDAVPGWQSHGSFLHFVQVSHTGVDPRTGVEVPTMRRRLVLDEDLPSTADFPAYLATRINLT